VGDSSAAVEVAAAGKPMFAWLWSRLVGSASIQTNLERIAVALERLAAATEATNEVLGREALDLSQIRKAQFGPAPQDSVGIDVVPTSTSEKEKE